ncbi:relaxase/mobilization nuclease domain-containing protein, partial [Armatimonas sp.]|uniref:relaxase/mobilization nuclease domain-containing protein n=1 Tax=Armatimonas sp. TaxID=1872638 RepID=UPI00375369BD
MRYITRPTAVRDGREGLLLVRLDVAEVQSFSLLRASLIAWAQTREAMEHLTPRREVQRGRTHYRATLGFERDIATGDALRLVGEWLDGALPKAAAVAAVHRDTARLHVHLWLDARQVDGRKIDLSARAWRQLDETWNRIYCR